MLLMGRNHHTVLGFIRYRLQLYIVQKNSTNTFGELGIRLSCLSLYYNRIY